MKECGQEALGGAGELVQLVGQPVTRLHRDPLGAGAPPQAHLQRTAGMASSPAQGWVSVLLFSLVLLPRPPTFRRSSL